MEAQQGEVVTAFELALVVPKRDAPAPAGDGDGDSDSDDNSMARDCVEFLVQQLRNAGLVVERVQGLSEEFLKVVLSLSLSLLLFLAYSPFGFRCCISLLCLFVERWFKKMEIV